MGCLALCLLAFCLGLLHFGFHYLPFTLLPNFFGFAALFCVLFLALAMSLSALAPVSLAPSSLLVLCRFSLASCLVLRSHLAFSLRSFSCVLSVLSFVVRSDSFGLGSILSW